MSATTQTERAEHGLAEHSWKWHLVMSMEDREAAMRAGGITVQQFGKGRDYIGLRETPQDAFMRYFTGASSRPRVMPHLVRADIFLDEVAVARLATTGTGQEQNFRTQLFKKTYSPWPGEGPAVDWGVWHLTANLRMDDPHVTISLHDLNLSWE